MYTSRAIKILVASNVVNREIYFKAKVLKHKMTVIMATASELERNCRHVVGELEGMVATVDRRREDSDQNEQNRQQKEEITSMESMQDEVLEYALIKQHDVMRHLWSNELHKLEQEEEDKWWNTIFYEDTQILLKFLNDNK